MNLNSWTWTCNSWIWTSTFEFQLMLFSFQLVTSISKLATCNFCFTILLFDIFLSSHFLAPSMKLPCHYLLMWFYLDFRKFVLWTDFNVYIFLAHTRLTMTSMITFGGKTLQSNRRERYSFKRLSFKNL